MGRKIDLKLNNGERPIANKYREGKMKRTLKRGLKVLEIAKREALKTSDILSESFRYFFKIMSIIGNFICIIKKIVLDLSFNISQNQFELKEKVIEKVGEQSLLSSIILLRFGLRK